MKKIVFVLSAMCSLLGALLLLDFHPAAAGIGDAFYEDQQETEGYPCWVWDEMGQRYYLDETSFVSGMFYTVDDITYYFDDFGYLASGWTEIDGEWYYFDSGVMCTMWQCIDGITYYFGLDGVMRTGWESIEGSWYYFDTDGAMYTMWHEIDGARYYFGMSGVMRTEWETIGSKKYYFGIDGAMRTMWQNIDGKRYYFGKTGVMRTMWETVGGKKYYFGKTGVMRTDWETVDGKKYYFGKAGVMSTMWQRIDGNRYYFGKTGVMRTMFEYIGSKAYYFGKTGVMRTGWETIGGNRYYFGKNGVMYTGLRKIGKYKYYFTETGAMIKNESFYIYSDGSGGEDCYVYYALPATSNKKGQVTTFADRLSKGRHAKGSQFRIVNVSDASENIGWSAYNSYVSPADAAILQKFAKQHFKAGMTWEEKIKITMEWIHYNVDYAYSGEKYALISGKTCADSVFTYRAGQCLQYNGAMAEMLTWMGYDVEMRFQRIDGWQHYWTVLKLGGKEYRLECGNHGKNGEWFFISEEE